MGMMEQCMEATGSGMMGVILLIATFLLFVWILGLAAVGALGVWGIKKLSGRPSVR